MRVRVVYESMFGTTAALAEAIAAGMRSHATVQLLGVDEAAELPDSTVDLLVVGGPTHAFGLSRAQSRAEAARRCGHTPATGTETGVREWLAAAAPVPAGTRAAAFGTRADKPAWLTGSAARAIDKRLRRLGFTLAAAPADFRVADTVGPAIAGELARAYDWGTVLAESECAQRV
ncbi:flavodoxin domain-containing protein [Nocardia jiangsuensis]|uniref:Flavodoxin domain-containing protein n=1 Tax=Nocardia jiangsuensis TaxID=1691563 RepID=A0ABV8DPG1_9NOCA